MARITLLTADELDAELAATVRAGEKTPLELGSARIYGHTPDIAKAFVAFMGTVRGNRTLPARLIELVRLRVAFHNQCRSCMAIRYQDGLDDGVTEDMELEPGCYLVRPPLVGADARRLRLAAFEREIPVTVICREPRTQLGF